MDPLLSAFALSATHHFHSLFSFPWKEAPISLGLSRAPRKLPPFPRRFLGFRPLCFSTLLIIFLFCNQTLEFYCFYLEFALVVFPSSVVAMGDWQELAQTVFIGLIFSYLVAKLISIVVHFKEENLRVVHGEELPEEEVVEREHKSELGETSLESNIAAGSGKQGALGVSESNLGDDVDSSDEDDDWEGVESTELDEVFSAATTFVAVTAADRSSAKVSNELQLQLYGLYKIATEGPCTAPQPSALKMAARAKWNAWQKLGAMPPEEAMEKYIMIVDELYPSWVSGSTTTKKKAVASHAPSSSGKGPMGPVFSSFIHEEESDNELKLDAIHVSAREGEVDNLVKYLESGASVNSRDSEGRTPLHWAVDRGQLHAAEILINSKADVNAKDHEGQTPLHYAALCEREAIAELLVKHDAVRDTKDNDGNTPVDHCGSSWNFMTSDN